MDGRRHGLSDPALSGTELDRQAVNLHFNEATLRWMDAGTGSAIQR